MYIYIWISVVIKFLWSEIEKKEKINQFTLHHHFIYLLACTSSIINPPSVKYQYISTPLNQYYNYMTLYNISTHIEVPHEETFHANTNMPSLK